MTVGVILLFYFTAYLIIAYQIIIIRIFFKCSYKTNFLLYVFGNYLCKTILQFSFCKSSFITISLYIQAVLPFNYVK